MATREACPECGIDFEGRRDSCPECPWEMEYPDTAPLKKLRDAQWGQLVAGYGAAGFVLFVFAAQTSDTWVAPFIGLLLLAWGVLFYFIPVIVARQHIDLTDSESD